MINISGISKGKVLKALYDNSRPLGMGMLQFVPGPMKLEEADEIVTKQLNFDYLQGRVMKVDISGDDFHPGSYDRDNGEGAAQKAINSIGRSDKTVTRVVIDKEQLKEGAALLEVTVPGSEKKTYSEFISIGFPEESEEGQAMEILGACHFEQQVAAMRGLIELVMDSVKQMDGIEQMMAMLQVHVAIEAAVKDLDE